MTYDLLGVLYTQPVLDDEGEILEEATPLQGWHLNTTEPLEGLDEYLVTPTVPRRVFAGVNTYFYIFESEAQCRELVPDAFSELEEIEDDG